MTNGKFGTLGSTSLILCLLAVGCCGPLAGTPTTVPTSALSSTPWPSVLALSQTMTSSSTYLQECLAEYPDSMTDQLQYEGILPGTTESDELLELVGTPREVRGENQREHIFDGFTVTLESELVDSVLVVAAADLYGSLRTILLTLGCPELVLATSTAEDGYPLAYDGTQFVYLRPGVVFAFDQHPVRLDANPIYAEYFVPTSLTGYLQWAHLDQDLATRQRPVDWNAAIR